MSNLSDVLTAAFQATRPRTYPLAVSGVMIGNALAFFKIGSFTSSNWAILGLTLLVSLGLQVLSNIANDYGDGIRGTDAHRDDRQFANNALTTHQFKIFLVIWTLLVFVMGVVLCFLSFSDRWERAIFIGLGMVAIVAAIGYTVGKHPYGYSAKSEIAVFLFFGWLNVLGSLYLQAQYIRVSDILAATIVGLFCTGVLMINNMRDIETDAQSGKYTLAVKLGKERVSQLYRFLILTAYFLLLTFGVLRQNYYILSTLVIAYPLANHFKVIRQYADETIAPKALAPELNRTVLLTLVTCFLTTVAILLFNAK